MKAKSKKLLLSFLIVLCLIITILYLFFTQKTNENNTINYAKNIDSIEKQNKIAVLELLKVKNSDVKIGDLKAPVQIISYDSFSCFYCAKFFTTVFPIIQKKYIDTGKVLFIHRDFPLDKSSLNASKLVKCFIKNNNPNEGKIFNLIRALFSSQSDWLVEANENDNSALVELFNLAGLKSSLVEGCLSDEIIENKILDERLQASKMLKINATPTFFINGKLLKGQASLAVFENEINAILN